MGWNIFPQINHYLKLPKSYRHQRRDGFVGSVFDFLSVFRNRFRLLRIRLDFRRGENNLRRLFQGAVRRVIVQIGRDGYKLRLRLGDLFGMWLLDMSVDRVDPDFLCANTAQGRGQGDTESLDIPRKKTKKICESEKISDRFQQKRNTH